MKMMPSRGAHKKKFPARFSILLLCGKKFFLMPLPPRATPSPREMVCETQDDGNRQTFSFFAFDHTKNFKGLEEKEPKEIWDEEKKCSETVERRLFFNKPYRVLSQFATGRQPGSILCLSLKTNYNRNLTIFFPVLNGMFLAFIMPRRGGRAKRS
jgi:hypothetical protein